MGSERMNSKIIALAGATLAIVVLAPTVIITHTYIVRPRQVDSLDDWFDVLLPVVPPVAALLSVLLLWTIGNRGPVGKGVVWGFFASSAAYMVLQAWTLSTQFTLISRDGTAHWAMLQLPAIWIVLPLLSMGIGIGAFVGWIVRRKMPNSLGFV